MKEFLDLKIFEYGKVHFYVSNLVHILIIILLSWTVLYIIKQALYRRVRRANLEKSSAYSALQIAKYLIWTLCIILSLQAGGLNVSLLLAGSAALLVGVGLGLQQTFSDFISGIILLLDNSIKIDDVLEFDGMIGRVSKIGVRTSTVITRDDVHVIVPNSKFTSDKVINWTHTGKLARFSITVGVNYKSDVQSVKEALLKCASEHGRVLKDPPSLVRFDDFGDSALTFNLFFYSNEIFRIEFIRSELRFAILEEFRNRGIEIPFPQRDLHIRTVSENIPGQFGNHKEL